MTTIAAPRLLLCCQALGIAGLLLPYLASAVTVWNSNPPGSAGNYTALLGAAVLGWTRWERLRGARAGRPWLACLSFAAAALLLVVAHQLDLLAFVGVGCVGLVTALLYQQYGLPGLVAMRLPLLLLLISVPVPGRVLAPLLRGFLDATLLATIAATRLCGLAPEVSGYTLTMAGGGRVELVEHCSGLDGFLLFVPLTLLLLEANRPVGRGGYLLVCLLAAPAAFFANLLRVVVESLLVAAGLRGTEADTVHEALGLGALVLAAAIIWGIGRLAHRRYRRRQEAA